MNLKAVGSSPTIYLILYILYNLNYLHTFIYFQYFINELMFIFIKYLCTLTLHLNLSMLFVSCETEVNYIIEYCYGYLYILYTFTWVFIYSVKYFLPMYTYFISTVLDLLFNNWLLYFLNLIVLDIFKFLVFINICLSIHYFFVVRILYNHFIFYIKIYINYSSYFYKKYILKPNYKYYNNLFWVNGRLDFIKIDSKLIFSINSNYQKTFKFALLDDNSIICNRKYCINVYSTVYELYNNKLAYRFSTGLANYNSYVTKFKINFRYSITLLNNHFILESLSFRNFFNKSLSVISKKARFFSSNFFLIRMLSAVNLSLCNVNFFFFNNINFFNLKQLDDFFKTLSKQNVNIDYVLFNINFSYCFNKYNKKMKTKKKFKKKIYSFIQKSEFSNLYNI